MDAEQLLVETLRDIRRRVRNDATEYELLGTAALLRKLLLDSVPLPDLVNRKYRVKLEYRINQASPADGRPGKGISFVMYGLVPGPMSSPVAAISVSREVLLSRLIVAVGDQPLSIRDVISFASNSYGAVHLAKPKTEKEVALNLLANCLYLGNCSLLVQALPPICSIVTAGLAGLEDIVLKDRQDIASPPPEFDESGFRWMTLRWSKFLELSQQFRRK